MTQSQDGDVLLDSTTSALQNDPTTDWFAKALREIIVYPNHSTPNILAAEPVTDRSAHKVVMLNARILQISALSRDLVRRVPQLNKKELAGLAELGALNALPEQAADRHPRGALWQVTAASRPVRELLDPAIDDSEPSQLEAMTPRERVYHDFEKSGLPIGKHPMSFCPPQLLATAIVTSEQAKHQRNGARIRVAGCVITRQQTRPVQRFDSGPS